VSDDAGLAERMVARAGRAVTVMTDEDATNDPPVHPAAAVFPMLADEELRDLADDIKHNGLIYDIVLDKTGAIVAGRNRFAACKLAGVEPRFMTLPDDADPVAYVLSENLQRRHMSAGQRAMAAARARLFLKNNQDGVASLAGVSQARIAYAATVIKYAPDLADLVLSGAEHLNAAYEKARARKIAAESAAESDARQRAEAERKTAKLRAEAPDLADLVAEWRLSLDDALAALRQRQEDEAREQRSATQLLVTVLDFLAPPAGDLRGHVKVTSDRIKLGCVPGSERISAERVSQAVAFLEALRPAIAQQEERSRNGLHESAR